MTHAERYLELGLRLGRHEPDLVDSYYGPEELRRRIDDEPLLEPARLAADAAGLLAELDDRWLAAQVRALETTARTLAGEELPYAEEVELTYGIRPRWIDEQEFERGHALLDDTLVGSGDLAARFARWFEEAALPAAALEPAVDEALALVRERTRETVGLPEGEQVELEIVTGELWFGYAHYLGGFRTRISVNTDLSFPAAELLWFAAHEGYPGHHTIDSLLEATFGGRVEFLVRPLFSPQSLLHEAASSLAASLAFSDAARLAFERDELFPLAGLDPADGRPPEPPPAVPTGPGRGSGRGGDSDSQEPGRGEGVRPGLPGGHPPADRPGTVRRPAGRRRPGHP